MKRTIIAFLSTIIAFNFVVAQEEYNRLYDTRFINLQWLQGNTEISEAHIKDEVTIRFETVNIPNNELINIEVWGKTDKGALDLMARLPGITNNGVVEVSWIVEFDEDDSTKSYYREITDRRYTIVDYFFIVRYNDISATSKDLAIMSWLNSKIVNTQTKEVYRNRKFLLICPDDSTMERRTTEEGHLNVYNLRMLGEYGFIFLQD